MLRPILVQSAAVLLSWGCLAAHLSARRPALPPLPPVVVIHTGLPPLFWGPPPVPQVPVVIPPSGPPPVVPRFSAPLPRFYGGGGGTVGPPLGGSFGGPTLPGGSFGGGRPRGGSFGNGNP